MTEAILQRIKACGVIAVVRLNDLSNAAELSRALIAGGVSIIEFTLTNPNAARAITDARAAVGDAGVFGAGSVTTVGQVREVAKAGATFVVSPVSNSAVIEACRAEGLPVMPGAYTPTEIQAAWEQGAAAVKVFPARGLGADYIRDVKAPLPHLRLVPTGGITADNAEAYIRAGAMAVGVGGSLVSQQAVAAADWQAITERAQALVSAVQQAHA